MTKEIKHEPVLLRQVIDNLGIISCGCYLDATVGLGGHSYEILSKSSPDGKLYGIDRDPHALSRAEKKLAEFQGRYSLLRGNYAEFDRLLKCPKEFFDGILLDLGVSSLQLLDGERGFSFNKEGPLDMRMDPSQKETVLSYLKKVSPGDLEKFLRDAGEERFAKRLVNVLKEGAQEWKTTLDLANAVQRCIPRRGKSHPATRVFLALRMAVNQELEGLKVFLEKAADYLKPKGRLAIISFHSTEDRLIKRFYSDVWKTMETMKRVTKSPIVSSWEEKKKNPRGRSAKLRVFEK